VLLGVARIEMGRGNYRAAEKILNRAGRVARDVGDAALEADIFAGLAACQGRRLEFARAERSLAEACRIAAMMKDAARQVRFLTARANLHVESELAGRLPDQALGMARRAVTLSRGTNLPLKDRFQALKTLAEVYLAMGRDLSAHAIFRKARSIVLDEGGPEELLAGIRPQVERLAKRLGKDKPRSILP
jgi:tetratricopeptide (TPR) repeat protein